MNRFSLQVVRNRIALLLCCLLTSLVAPPPAAGAALTSLTLPGDDPEQVTFGMHIESVHTLDFSTDTFQVSGFVWWRFRSAEFNPLQTMQIIGARNVRTGAPVRLKFSDGTQYMGFYVFAEINQDLDPARYPYDRHRLRIVFETPYPATELKLIPDTANTRLSDDPYAPGWKLSNMAFTEATHAYRTDFGIPALGHNFSRAVIAVDAKRSGAGHMIDSFIGFIVAALICLGAYLVNPMLLAPRATLIACATFSAVTNKYLVNAHLAPLMRSHLSDMLAFGAFLMIITLLIMSVTCERMIEGGRRAAAIRLNKIALASVAVLYITAFGIVFFSIVF